MAVNRIYLQEEPKVVLGMEAEYAAAVKSVLYPMMGPDCEMMRLCPVGAFRHDTAYDPEWTTFTFLWSYEAGWDDYARDRDAGATSQAKGESDMTEAYEQHPGLSEYIRTAGKYRSRSLERLLVPVDFSPAPAPLPERTSPNSVVLRQEFTLEKQSGPAFLEQMKNSVLPASHDIGLKIELLARVVGRPRDYIAYWTVPGWSAWAALQKSRDPSSETNFLPGSDALWKHVAEIAEFTLAPFAYSPLGGLA